MLLLVALRDLDGLPLDLVLPVEPLQGGLGYPFAGKLLAE